MPSPPTPTRGRVTTAAWTSCAGPGWHGNGPIPWEHEPNRGFLRSLHMLAASAAAIGEDDEAGRCEQFLRESSPTAAAELGVAELGAAELADAGPTARP